MRYKVFATSLAILALSTGAASAATYTYQYIGAPFVEWSQGSPPPEFVDGARYEAILSISEEKLGQPLRGLSTEFYFIDEDLYRHSNTPRLDSENCRRGDTF